MKKELTYEVTKVKYLGGYKLKVTYADDYSVSVDFTKAIEKYAQGDFSKWRQPANFKKFKIAHGNLVWGRDWDLFFRPESIRSKRIELKP
jgi:hypothetical protein